MAQRQCDTNQLAIILAKHVLSMRAPSGDDLYAIFKLAWITKVLRGYGCLHSQHQDPSDRELIGIGDLRESTLHTLAREALKQGISKDAGPLFQRHTGFNNFYKAYRNSVRGCSSFWRGHLLPQLGGERNHEISFDTPRVKYLRCSRDENLITILPRLSA